MPLKPMAHIRRAAAVAIQQFATASTDAHEASSSFADLITTSSPTSTPGVSSGYTLDGTYTSRNNRNTGIVRFATQRRSLAANC